MTPVTDEQVAAYERLESARLRVANLDEVSQAGMSLKERAAWHLAYGLAVRETTEARVVWDWHVEQAARESSRGMSPETASAPVLGGAPAGAELVKGD